MFIDDKIKENLKLSYDERVDYREKREVQPWKISEINKILDYFEKESKVNLLDLGSGPGKQGRIFKDNGIDVTCIDISEEMVQACKTKSLKAYEMDFYNLNFENESFDVVWSMNTLLHVPKNSIDKVLSNIKRILKPNGICYIGIYGGYDFEGIWQEDSYNPKRFFSFYNDNRIKEIVEKHFDIEQFDIVLIEDSKLHYQTLILRKR